MSTFDDELDSISALLTPRNVRESVFLVPLDEIQVDPNQPRKSFDQEAMNELIESIKKYGVLQPIGITGQEVGGKHTIVFGERRYRACLAIGKKDIPTIKVRGHISDVQMIENIQREDLSPIEIAQWIQEKIQNGETELSLAQRLGKSKSYVSNHKLLSGMPDYIQRLYDEGFCKSPRMLADLNRQLKNNKEQIKTFCESVDKPITKKDIQGAVPKPEIKEYKTPSINLLKRSKKHDVKEDEEVQEPKHTNIIKKGVVVRAKSLGKSGYLNLNEKSGEDKVSVSIDGKNQYFSKDDLSIEKIIA